MADQAQDQSRSGGQAYGPGGPPPLSFEMFAGVNTATTRIGVQDEQAYWLDGFMPLAPRNLRTLYGIGNALYTASGGKTIVCFYFYNIGATPYVLIFLSDGSAIQVNTLTAAAVTVLPVGTITTPSITTLGISQWGSQYLLIVATQTNGYWCWDGSILYQAGTLAPGVTLTDVGSGYVTPPAVNATGGNGHGAVFAAVIADGSITAINILNPGTGYLATDTVDLTIAAPPSGGNSASLTAVLSKHGPGSGASITPNWALDTGFYYYVASITIANGGSSYSTSAVGTWSNTTLYNGLNSGWASPGPSTISLTITGGVITGVTLTGGGFWANRAGGPLPTISISDPGNYSVTSVTIVDGGTDYGPNTVITASGGGSPQSQAVISPIIAGGVITSTTIVSGGLYGSNTAPTLTVMDSPVDATAVISLWPYGISGNFIETFQGHVWVLDGANGLVSAPGSVSDFATSAGGVQFTSEDSFLKIGYTAAVQTNGFLFLIGDNSMNYISGVTTTGTSPPTTTFTNNNSDPEVGSPYPASVTTLGQEILIGNSTGIFVSSGGAFVKRSETLDGVFNTVPASNFNANPFNGFQLSAAKATIFGKRVWMVLVPIVDPVSNAVVNKILMYNGKFWWASMQDVALTFISGQEINSVYTAWGTDGTHLYPLFNQPSTNFTKLAQSRLWDAPGGYEFSKAAARFWSMWQCYNTTDTTITLDVDAVGIGTSGQFTNTQPYSITGPTTLGYFITPPQAIGNQGILTGMTLSTNAADMALVSARMWDEIVGYTG